MANIKEDTSSNGSVDNSDFESELENQSLEVDKLEELKKKLNSKGSQEKESFDMEEVSIKLGVVGVGQAGSRIAQELGKMGYPAYAINTSKQDLEYIDVPMERKLLLEGSLGGTGKDLDLGREIFLENYDIVQDFVDGVVDGNDMLYLCLSGGGGTGSSSVDTMVEIMTGTGAPVGVIYVLPKETDDAQAKKNALETLSRLAGMSQENTIANLIVVDNAKIEQIYADLSQAEFWDKANTAIVEPLHIFNSLTATASRHTSLDPSDFAKIISCGDCSVYGVIEVENYMEETALAEAVIESLNQSMLAEGFDISQARVGGIIVTGTKKIMDKIPAININYCYHMVSEQTKGASLFQGVYDVHTKSDSVKIYTWLAGLGLPRKRIETLREESSRLEEVSSEKISNRKSQMTLDLGGDNTKSATEEIHRKIQKKQSGFGRLQRGRSSLDRRRKR
jgi:cell division GTPase FtsZ